MSKQNLYINGMREPLSLGKEEAEFVQSIKSDPSKPPSTPIVLPNIWTGTKADVRYVHFIKDEEKSYIDLKIDPMTTTEALAFEFHIKKAEKSATDNGFQAFEWTVFYLQNQGGIRLEYWEQPSKSKAKCYTIHVVEPSIFEEGQTEISRYMLWYSRKQFAEKQKTQELEQMAQEQQILQEIEEEFLPEDVLTTEK